MKKKILSIICLCLCLMLPFGLAGCSLGDTSMIEEQMEKLKTQITIFDTKIDGFMEDLESLKDSENQESEKIEISSNKEAFDYLKAVISKTYFDADGNLNNLTLTSTIEEQGVDETYEVVTCFGYLESGINFFYEKEEGLDLEGLVYEDSIACYEVLKGSNGEITKIVSEGTVEEFVSNYNVLNRESIVVRAYEEVQEGGFKIELQCIDVDEEAPEYLYKSIITITTNENHKIETMEFLTFEATYNETAKEYSEFELMQTTQIAYSYDVLPSEDVFILLSIALNKEAQ